MSYVLQIFAASLRKVELLTKLEIFVACGNSLLRVEKFLLRFVACGNSLLRVEKFLLRFVACGEVFVEVCCFLRLMSA